MTVSLRPAEERRGTRARRVRGTANQAFAGTAVAGGRMLARYSVIVEIVG